MLSYKGPWEERKVQVVPNLSNPVTDFVPYARRNRWTKLRTTVPIAHRGSSSGRISSLIRRDGAKRGLTRESRDIDKDIWLKDLSKPKLPLAVEFQQQTELGTREGAWSFRLDKEFQTLCKQGQLDRALDVLLHMHQQSIVPSVNMYRSLLKACGERKVLAQAKRIYAHLFNNELLADSFLGEYLVSTLVKCGGHEAALELFDCLPQRTVFSWAAMISLYATSGQGREALKLYQRMQDEGVEPNAYTFVNLLKACTTIADLHEGKRIHAEALKYGYKSDLVVCTCLIDMYGKCGSIINAENVFDRLWQRDVVSWNAMLAAYVQQGQAEKVFQLYEKMQEGGVSPSNRTFVSMLQACSLLAEKEKATLVAGQFTKIKSLQKGKGIHAIAKLKSCDTDVFVRNTLVSFYGNCGSIEDAQNAFDGLHEWDVVAWTAILLVYVEQGQSEKALWLYNQMWIEGITPNDRTFVAALQACCMLAGKEKSGVSSVQHAKVKSLERGKAIHAEVRREGYDSDVFVGTSLVSMYGKCGSIVDALNVFDGLPKRNVVLWNAMLVACAEHDQPEKVLQLYDQIFEEDFSPNDRTFVSALRACSMLAERETDFLVDGQSTKRKCLLKGRAIHSDAQRKGCATDTFVGNTLVSMYGKCGSIAEAQEVFDRLSSRDVVGWTAMLTVHLEHRQAVKALQLYGQMLDANVSPDARAFVTAVRACGMLAEEEQAHDAMDDGQATKAVCLEKGKAIHADVERKGFDSNVFVGSSLISMYSKCGSIAEAQAVFDGLPVRDVVSWNVMLAAYVEQGAGEVALQLYFEMQQEGVSPDDVTNLWVVQACSNTGSLGMLRQISGTVLSAGKGVACFVKSALICAYGRCGSMVEAQTVFDALPKADIVSWNALIGSYARQGDWAASLEYYERMQVLGVHPNAGTFLSLVCACSHAGLVETGVEYFESMSRDYGLTPEIEHYASMVDLLGRAGCFTQIEGLLSTMPMQPDLAIWLCLLSACRKHGEVVLGERAFEQAVCLEPKHSASYVIMSSMYVDAGLWDRASAVKELRHKECAWKERGQTWIQHDEEGHTFVVGDRKYPQQQGLYNLLEQLHEGVEQEEQYASGA